MSPSKTIQGAAAIFAAAMLLVPTLAFAHQPRVVESSPVVVTQPEISKAYYAQLKGEPQVYTITAAQPFTLYLQIVVPDKPWAKDDVSAAIIFNGDTQLPLAVLNASTAQWSPFYEPFGNDKYLEGPEFKSRVGPGTYEIRVWSSNNDSKYALVVGEAEMFDFKETWNAVALIPGIKRDFFEESPITFLFSPFGVGYIIVMLVLSVAVGMFIRFVAHRWGRVKHKQRNLGFIDRLVRLMIGVMLFIWAITSSWNPLLLFVAGLAFYQAFSGWCAIYDVFGWRTCKSS